MYCRCRTLPGAWHRLPLGYAGNQAFNVRRAALRLVYYAMGAVRVVRTVGASVVGDEPPLDLSAFECLVDLTIRGNTLATASALWLPRSLRRLALDINRVRL